VATHVLSRLTTPAAGLRLLAGGLIMFVIAVSGLITVSVRRRQW
jgi:hypothetical protein